MTTSETNKAWKQRVVDLIAGTEAELLSADSSELSKELQLFLERLKRPILKRDREQFEDESLIESDKALKAAAWRHLDKIKTSAITEAVALIKSAENYLKGRKHGLDRSPQTMTKEMKR